MSPRARSTRRTVAPALAVVGQLRCRSATLPRRPPAQREHAELARHAVVDVSTAVARDVAAASRSRAGRRRRSRLVTRQRRGRRRRGAGVAALAGSSRRSRRSKQTLPLPAPLPEAITSSTDARAPQRAVGRRTPGELDVALAKPDASASRRGTRKSVRCAHHTLSPVASTSLNCSALGGASPRTFSANSKRAGKSIGRDRRALT